MTTSMTKLRILPLALTLILGACVTTSKEAKPVPVAGPVKPEPKEAAPAPDAAKKPAEPVKPGEPIIPKISTRAQRLFDDAVAAEAEMKKLKVPTDWDSLEKKWNAVLAAEEVPEAYYNLGVIHEHLKKVDQAKQDYQKALALKPTLKEAAINLAVIMENEGNAQSAIATYRDVLKKYPEDATARVRLAAKYREAGQLDDAWRYAREALMRDPKAVGAYKVMMRVALERGNLNMAKLLALRALKLDDRDHELYFFVGQILDKEEDEPAAEIQYRKALAVKDDFMPARHELLKIAVKKQHWEGVADQCSRIIKYEPNNAAAHLNLGIALRYMGQPDPAMLEYEKAEKLSGDKLPATHLNRGLVIMKIKNDCTGAIAEFQKYTSAAGASLGNEAPVYALQKECENILVENKKAAELAKQIQEEEAKKKKEEAEKKAEEERKKKEELEAKKNGGKPGETKPGETKPDGKTGPTTAAKGPDGKPGAAPDPDEPPPEPKPDPKPEPKKAPAGKPEAKKEPPRPEPKPDAPAPAPKAEPVKAEKPDAPKPEAIDPDEPKG